MLVFDCCSILVCVVGNLGWVCGVVVMIVLEVDCLLLVLVLL